MLEATSTSTLLVWQFFTKMLNISTSSVNALHTSLWTWRAEGRTGARSSQTDIYTFYLLGWDSVCVCDGSSSSLTVRLCVIFWWVWQIGAPGSVIEEPGPTRLNYSWAALWHGVDCHDSEDTKSHFLIALLSLTVLFIYNSAFIISNVFL